MIKNFQKSEKNAKLFKKIAKICDIQKLRPIPWQLKIFQKLTIQPLMSFSCPWDSINLNDDNNYVKKHEKIATFVKTC